MKNINLKENKNVIIAGILAIILLIVIGFVIFNGSPEQTMKKKLEAITVDFYENVYYESMKSGLKNEEELKKHLAQYPNGIQMKLSTMAKYKLKTVNINEEIKFFKDPKTKKPCDYEETKGIVIPKKPFGKKDYTIKTEVVCKVEEKKDK